MHTLTKILTNQWATRRNALIAICGSLVLVGCIGGYVVLANNPNERLIAVQTSGATNQSDLLAGHWSYLPGSTREHGALRIRPLDFRIVEQNGSGGQANPPINQYGTHLEKASNFTVTTHLREVTGTAAMQLFGRVPVVADEFRIERGSIRVAVSGQQVHVQIWNGQQVKPVVSQSLPLPGGAAENVSLTISHANGKLSVAAQGKMLTTVNAQHIFANGFVWFGFEAETASFVVDRLTAKSSGSTTFRVTDSGTLRVTKPDPNGLQTLVTAKRPDFTVGAAMALGPAVADPAYAATAFGGNFGALTTENALKWQFTEPSQGMFDFKEADALVQLAKRHHMQVHGHTLVFGEANPAWVQHIPLDQLEEVMTNHIRKTVTHFKGNVHSWDVVNEPFDDDEWDQLRPHRWQQAMGEAYIAKAFRTAHQTDPAALLFMNEYGLEEDGKRWDAFLAFVQKLKADGVPIHGIGFQSHVYESADTIDAAVLRKHIRQLASLGIQSRISEMDVYSDDGQTVQARQYSSVLQACLAEPSCISWTTWGVSDRYNYFIDDDGSVQQGNDFLWDEHLKPTPAVKALRDMLRAL